MVTRTVVVLCGPPGAGKTTAARASGLKVFDRDDPEWTSEKQFTEALALLADDPRAQAVVIRSGASSSARAKAAALVNATHVFLVMQERDELMRRIKQRDRHDAIQSRAAVDAWTGRFDRRDGVRSFPGWGSALEPDLGVVSDW